MTSTIACFIIDFILGVNIAKMWVWYEYRPFDYFVMYTFMNGAYVFSMYELFRISKALIKRKVTDKHLVKLRINATLHRKTVISAVVIGVLFIVIPFYPVFLGKDVFIEYIMILPFIGTTMIADGITFLLKGRPIIAEIFRFNLRYVLALFFSIIIASVMTEVINLFAKEWSYVKMPFSSWQLFGIPLSVFIGWAPLVVSTVAIVNFIKRLDYVIDSKS